MSREWMLLSWELSSGHVSDPKSQTLDLHEKKIWKISMNMVTVASEALGNQWMYADKNLEERLGSCGSNPGCFVLF